MRVLVETTTRRGGWDITYRDPANGNTLAPPRSIDRCPPPYDCFPVPPAHPPTACTPQAHAVCTDATGATIGALYQSVNQLDVPAGDIDIYGGYLFHCLLGDNWPAIEFLAPPADGIELELLIPRTDSELSSLWWEMMFLGKVPLGVQRTRKVAITRVIAPADAANPVPQPAPLQLPLRVLFIVGREIDNSLSPGAELFGLLNRVPVHSDAALNRFETAQLHVRLIPNAAWDEIQSACASFEPEVVHIVSHGELDPAGGSTRLLLTARAPANPAAPQVAPEKTNEAYPCSAQRLLQLVTVNGSAPKVMVVNACHTAEYLGVQDLAFTAQLVEGGVAVALGMSGEVADRACQVFTLSFYQALLLGASVSQAAAAGRRAAMLDFPEYVHNIEWARPTLFQAAGINPVLGTSPSVRNYPAITARYRSLFPDVLCDRIESMKRYEAFRASVPAPGRPAMLAVVSKEKDAGLGKTRLLEEIAARSIFDKFVPVLVRHDKTNPDAPQNFLEMALQISAAAEKTRQYFGLPRRNITRARQFAYDQSPIVATPNDAVNFPSQQARLNRFLRDEANRTELAALGHDVVLSVIQNECNELRGELTLAGHPPPIVLLLLDDLHRYASCDVIVDLIREDGLGTPGIPLPVVFSYYAGEQGKLIEEALRKMPDLPVISLSPFETEIEQQLAFRQFVLSQFGATVSSRREMSTNVENFFKDMLEFTKGRPGEFWNRDVQILVRIHKSVKTLESTDLDRLLPR